MTTTTMNQKRGQLVNTPYVDQLIRNYKKERWVHNSDRLGKADSLSTWYGLEELSSFLQLAKKHQADGIRMYFGLYPNDFEKEPEFQGRQTVVLVATKQKKIESGTINKNIYIQKEGRLEILAFNFGSMCPPYCGTGDQSASDDPFGFDMEKIGLSIIENGDDLTII